jgi:Xaa-Pro aminopeptidase
MATSRIKKLQKQISSPLLVVKKENLFYFTGQHFVDGWLLVTKKQTVFFGNGLEMIRGVKSKLYSALPKYFRAGQKLNVEDSAKVEEWSYFKKKLKGVKLVPASGVGERLRVVKSKAELADLEQAYKITAAVFAVVKLQLKKKQWTEEGLARYIRIWGLELGADEVSFDPIVAVGANAAIPHHRPGPTVLKRGQSIVLDFGFKVNGYCSDFTRTVFLGSVPPKLRAAYEEAETAYKLAFSFAAAGKAGGEVDDVARSHLARAKLDKYFIHSLGHGTGLEVHELPHISPRSSEKLQNGMVFSIEPGVYFPNLGGIRIEDLVYLEKGKPQYFIKVPTDLKSNTIK